MASHDRSAEDLGNIVALEHLNTKIPDQRLATLFYITGLGLTRDPFLMTSVDNMWVNIGRSQFHLPMGGPEIVPGRIGLVLPDRAALLQRLQAVRERLKDTKFDFKEHNDYVEVVSPWGNRIRCHEPDARFGDVILALPYIELDATPGSARAIARFYRDVLEASVETSREDGAEIARVAVGNRQYLVFRETDAPAASPYPGHHVQVYVANFSRPYERLRERNLITEDGGRHQYNFADIVDVDTGKVVARLEHEVRSMTHPLYARPLVNRDASRTNRNFTPGHEIQPWALERQ